MFVCCLTHVIRKLGLVVETRWHKKSFGTSIALENCTPKRWCVPTVSQADMKSDTLPVIHAASCVQPFKRGKLQCGDLFPVIEQHSPWVPIVSESNSLIGFVNMAVSDKPGNLLLIAFCRWEIFGQPELHCAATNLQIPHSRVPIPVLLLSFTGNILQAQQSHVVSAKKCLGEYV